MRSAKIAVIIPVHNRKKDLIELLKTIFEMDYTNFDVIIVDNGSTDGISEISIHYPKLKILRNEKNYGAPIGFNIGIKYALSVDLYKYLWLLDSDLLVHKGCLSILVDIMEKDESIGIAGAKI